MWKSLLTVCFVGVLTLASPTRERVENSASPVHIIKPPVRCPEGMKPDANGKCRVVWGRNVDAACPEGEFLDEDGICRDADESPECFEGDCLQVKKVEKRDVERSERRDGTETAKPFAKLERMEVPKSEKKSKKRRAAEDGRAAKQARSKHAFIMMLKKKKMQMMKPKPPPHHPPHHHPPHNPPPGQEEPEEEPEEEQPEQPEQPEGRFEFFGDEACVGAENSTGSCQPDAEIVADVEPNKEFKEWQPEKSSESSESSSSSSSSSDSTGESESEGGSEESEDEVLEKAIKIKLMKLFRMKQRYGPALRRWLATQLREYEDSLDEEKDTRR